MSRIIKSLILGIALVTGNLSYAASLTGSGFVVDFFGNELFPGGQPITGNIDVANKIMQVDPWGPFFGFNITTNNIELLEPGSYTRSAGAVTVPPGHVGAHVQIEWNNNIMFSYMVWDVINDGTNELFRIIDSDGDGVPGHALTNGPFPGITVYYEFDAEPTSGPPQPGVFLALIVEGGSQQECTGDLSADVTINAMPVAVGGAELDAISWTVDGLDVGTGLSITENLSLGNHIVEATALTTTGQSDVESTVVNVEDTVRPEVNIAYIDRNGNGNEVDSGGSGLYEISIKSSDSCDPDPVVTNSSITPITSVTDGDVISINASQDNLGLPVSAIRVTASSKDAAGNFSFSSSKTFTVE